MSKKTTSELVAPSVVSTRSRPGSTGGDPKVGLWYYVKEGKDRWLGCVVHVGSNYVELNGPSESHASSTSTARVHFDEFWEHCEFEPRAEEIIRERIAGYQEEVRRLMSEVRGVVGRLGVGPRQAIADADSALAETSLAVISGTSDAKQYGKDLVKAKEKTLPDLFEKIKKANELAASWMKATLIPLSAEVGGLKSSLEIIKDRIFSVELYAGLVEEVTVVREGKPAGPDEKIHLHQRRAYMDEECLARYEAGGMELHDLGDFDKWLSKPENCDRLLPFGKCMVAFRVRRHMKERDFDGSLFKLFDNINAEEADKRTFLYIRNGEQIHRLSTGVEFGERLFPDQSHSVSLGGGESWAKVFCDRVDEIVTDADYQTMLIEAKKKLKASKKGDRWHAGYDLERLEREYKKFSPESVYYDDIRKKIEGEMKEHNRIVLILQGLLDRSPVFHPHPPWQLWTAAGFESALKLVYDDSRALAPANMPDFVVYLARLNKSLRAGSLTVGQREVWIEKETARENERMANSWRTPRGHDYRHTRYIPPGNPGPKLVDVVASFSRKSRVAMFKWTRERLTYRRWRSDESRISCSVGAPESRLLNIDAYTPGDFHQFFDDPRTRAAYLKWSPFLLVAEDVKAGKRADPRNGKQTEDEESD